MKFTLKIFLLAFLIIFSNLSFSFSLEENTNSENYIKSNNNLRKDFDNIIYEFKELGGVVFDYFKDIINEIFDEKSGVPPSEQYDYYVFTIAWSDSYCRASYNPAQCYELLHHLQTKRTFRIHGLWPSRKDGVRLDSCNQGDYIPIPESDEEPFVSMKEIWPTLANKGCSSFWGHEFNKHGYCYTDKYHYASYTPYFEKTIELYNQLNIPDLMKNAFGGNPGDKFSLSKDEIEEELRKVLGGDFFEIDCVYKDGEHFLNEVRMYLDMDFQKMDGFRLISDCPKGKKINFYMEYDN